MAFPGNEAHQHPRGAGGRFPARWECRCQQPPVLLATYDERGRIHIKARDRYWHVDGAVQTVCPRCGSEHTLDPRRERGSIRDAIDLRDVPEVDNRSAGR